MNRREHLGRFRAAVQAPLADPQAERVRRNTDARITEMQAIPIVNGRLLRGLELPDDEEFSEYHIGTRALDDDREPVVVTFDIQ